MGVGTVFGELLNSFGPITSRLSKIMMKPTSVGEDGDEVLYGTNDGKVGLVQLSR